MGSNANGKQIGLKNCLQSLFVHLVHSEIASVSTLHPANSRFSWVSGVTFNTMFPKGNVGATFLYIGTTQIAEETNEIA